MSDNHIRRRFPVSRRARSRALKPSPSGHRRYTPVPVKRRSSKQHSRDTNYKTLERCKSEPCILKIGVIDFDDDLGRDVTAPSLEILLRPQTCSDIFLSPDYHYSGSPQSFQGYKKEAKVIVNVTVEGSPGPVRTMVKLGSSVDETIRLVIDKYSEEGRTPRLDKNADSSFQLYQSYFSLQSLSNTDAIGDVGSRSFYLRKSNSSNGSNASNGEIASEIAPVVPLGFFGRKINKVIRRSCKLWKILGCMQCSG
ncbi:PREDICTED: uncharacterized protein At4g22758 [Nicotiana attenuata]|uniref:DUF7054 domain-containing protein n=1 Tax=Nicotiana attenuata TaxID=49451 RepID=A0A1J6KZS3_NICAT|nr:PREDICTED: uncharacterized protein At4g22758 [Nicotiana attenuata]OIT27103.1 uncharacterized protein A4A49_23043 [Nicotiana attenuata]